MNRFVKLALAAVLAVLSLAVILKPSEPAMALTVSRGVIFAGDSVRFVAQFTVPAQAPVDSVVGRWSAPFNALAQFRKWTPSSLPATITDTALFAAPPTVGGGNGFGEFRITVWRGSQSTTVQKGLEITVPDLSPPLGVTGVVFLDSAVVFN